MPIPDPEPGMIVRYDYLWRREDAAGRDHGKTRPTCIVVAEVNSQPNEVLLLPITHSPPLRASTGIVIPQSVKRLIGLDEEPSWVIVSECNHDVWPNSGLSAIPGKFGEFSYGFIPPGLFSSVRKRFLEHVQKGNVIVTRN